MLKVQEVVENFDESTSETQKMDLLATTTHMNETEAQKMHQVGLALDVMEKVNPEFSPIEFLLKQVLDGVAEEAAKDKAETGVENQELEEVIEETEEVVEEAEQKDQEIVEATEEVV